MTHNILGRLAALTLWVLSAVSVAAAAQVAGGAPQVRSGERVPLGRVGGA